MIPRNTIHTNGMTSRGKGKEIFLVFVDILFLGICFITSMQTTASFEQGKVIWESSGNAENKAVEETCTVLKVHLKYLVA